MVGALSVARSARMAVTAAPPSTPETIPSPSPQPRPSETLPPPSTRNTPALATTSATARWRVGRSFSRKNESTTAQIGKVLLRRVASPAGIRAMARK